MSNLSAEITVSESVGHGVRYVLPRRVGIFRSLGLFFVVLGAIIFVSPIVYALFELFHIRAAGAGFLQLLLLRLVDMPLAYFIALGALMLFLGLVLAFGRCEIVVRPGRLYAVNRWGLICLWNSFRLDRLRAFRVESYAAFQPYGGECILVADLENGKMFKLCFGYPGRCLRPLAEELSIQCKQAIVYGCGTSVEIPASEELVDDSIIQKRPRQPTNSNAIVAPATDRLIITIPPAGLLRGANGCLVVCVIFWDLFILAFLALVLCGPFKFLALVLLVSPHSLLGIGLTCYIIHCCYREVQISVSAEGLTITKSGPFGARQYHWKVNDLNSVTAKCCYIRARHGGHWVHSLDICTRQGKSTSFLSYRPRGEVEWIATLLEQALQCERTGP